MAGQDYLTLSRSARYAGAEEGQTRITKRYGMAKSNRGNIKARKSDDEFLRRGSYKKINDCKETMDCEEVNNYGSCEEIKDFEEERNCCSCEEIKDSKGIKDCEKVKNC